MNFTELQKGSKTEFSVEKRETLCRNGERRTFLMSENFLYEEAVAQCQRLGGELGMEWQQQSGLKTLFNGTCDPERPILAPIRQGPNRYENGSLVWFDDRKNKSIIHFLNWEG